MAIVDLEKPRLGLKFGPTTRSPLTVTLDGQDVTEALHLTGISVTSRIGDNSDLVSVNLELLGGEIEVAGDFASLSEDSLRWLADINGFDIVRKA